MGDTEFSAAPFGRAPASKGRTFPDKGCRKMGKRKAHCFWAGIFALSFSMAYAQTPQQIIQQAVDTERAADQNDHSNWIYLEEVDKPKEHVLQWVAATQQGSVERVLERDDHQLPEAQQGELVQRFLHDHQGSEEAGVRRRITTTGRSMTCSSSCRPPLSGRKQEQPAQRLPCTLTRRQTSDRLRARRVSSAA